MIVLLLVKIMNSNKKYFEIKKNNEPNKLLKEFFLLNPDISENKNAIDLGCGSGRDTIALLKKGYNVLSIDKDSVESTITKNIPENEIKRFKFIKGNFEELIFPSTDLFVSNFALSFCSFKNFDILWNKIVDSINIDGFIVGNIFGINDEWNDSKHNMTFLNRIQVLEKLSSFQIIKFFEKEFDGITTLGKQKHWHIFYFIAKKVSK